MKRGLETTGVDGKGRRQGISSERAQRAKARMMRSIRNGVRLAKEEDHTQAVNCSSPGLRDARQTEMLELVPRLLGMPDKLNSDHGADVAKVPMKHIPDSDGTCSDSSACGSILEGTVIKSFEKEPGKSKHFQAQLSVDRTGAERMGRIQRDQPMQGGARSKYSEDDDDAEVPVDIVVEGQSNPRESSSERARRRLNARKALRARACASGLEPEDPVSSSADDALELAANGDMPMSMSSSDDRGAFAPLIEEGSAATLLSLSSAAVALCTSCHRTLPANAFNVVKKTSKKQKTCRVCLSRKKKANGPTINDLAVALTAQVDKLVGAGAETLTSGVGPKLLLGRAMARLGEKDSVRCLESSPGVAANTALVPFEAAIGPSVGRTWQAADDERHSHYRHFPEPANVTTDPLERVALSLLCDASPTKDDAAMSAAALLPSLSSNGRPGRRNLLCNYCGKGNAGTMFDWVSKITYYCQDRWCEARARHWLLQFSAGRYVSFASPEALQFAVKVAARCAEEQIDFERLLEAAPSSHPVNTTTSAQDAPEATAAARKSRFYAVMASVAAGVDRPPVVDEAAGKDSMAAPEMRCNYCGVRSPNQDGVEPSMHYCAGQAAVCLSRAEYWLLKLSKNKFDTFASDGSLVYAAEVAAKCREEQNVLDIHRSGVVPMSSFCSDCGRKFSVSFHRFCGSCGAPRTQAEQAVGTVDEELLRPCERRMASAAVESVASGPSDEEPVKTSFARMTPRMLLALSTPKMQRVAECAAVTSASAVAARMPASATVALTARAAVTRTASAAVTLTASAAATLPSSASKAFAAAALNQGNVEVTRVDAPQVEVDAPLLHHNGVDLKSENLVGP